MDGATRMAVVNYSVIIADPDLLVGASYAPSGKVTVSAYDRNAAVVAFIREQERPERFHGKIAVVQHVNGEGIIDRFESNASLHRISVKPPAQATITSSLIQ